MARLTYTPEGDPYYIQDETDTPVASDPLRLTVTPRLPVDTRPMISDEQLTMQRLDKENAPWQFAPAITEGFSNAKKLLAGEKLPIEPVAEDNRSAWQRDLNAAFETQLRSNPLTAGFAALTTDPRTGVRYQTWPEKMIRNAIGGEPASFDPVTGQTSEQTIERAQDISGMMGGGSFSRAPEAAIARSDTAANAPISALAKAPRFYSALENAVKDSKTKVATAEQWLGEIRNKPGVKPEEIDWVLHELPTGKITKPELEQFIQEHKVELKEVNLGDYGQKKREALAWTSWYDDMRPVVMEINSLKDVALARQHNPNFREHFKRFSDEEIWEDVQEYKKLPYQEFTGPTKYSQWQLPGGTNYREMIMTLPNSAANLSEIATLRARHAANRQEVKNLIDAHEPRNYVNNIEKISKLGEEANAINNRLADLEKGFTHSHWPGITNPIAHVRTNERTISGVGNSLHVEEIQSDLHQQARKQGYKGEIEKLKPEFDKIESKLQDAYTEAFQKNMPDMESFDREIFGNPDIDDAMMNAVKRGIINKQEADLYKRYTQIESARMAGEQPIMDAPFKSGWADLALKRIIRQAAEEGKDAISWTPGEAQALRYPNELRRTVKSIEWIPSETTQGHRQIVINPVDASPFGLRVNEKGVLTGGAYAGQKLSDAIGKEMAAQIMKENKGKIEGKDFVIGAEGMKAFYDKMLVDKANAIAKKFGGKVENANLSVSKSKINMDDVRPDQIAQDKYREEWDKLVAQKQELYPTIQGRTALAHPEYISHLQKYNIVDEKMSTIHNKMVYETMERMRKDEKGEPIHLLRLTPQLKDAALHKGFSLFADTGKIGAPLAALTRVEHNPFQVGYHGTPTPGFEKFSAPRENYMLDRMLGVHVARDPKISDTFTIIRNTTGKSLEDYQGGMYKVKIPEDSKFLKVDQPLHKYAAERGEQRTNRNIISDQAAIEPLIMKTAFQKEPEMLARYLNQARAVPEADALPLAKKMVAGEKVTLPVDGEGWNLDRFIRNFNGKPYNDVDRARAIELFKQDMKDKGYVGLKYTNTSPMETANAKDFTSYVVFEPSKHIRNALTGQLMSDTSANAPLAALAKQHGVKLTPVADNPFTTEAYHGAPKPFRGERIQPISGVEIIPIDNKFAVWDQVMNKRMSPDLETKEAAHDWLDKKGFGDFYSTSNKKLAEDYAMQHSSFAGFKTAPHVMPLKLNTRDYHVVDAKGQPWDAVNHMAIFEAQQLGKKGVTIHNVLDDPNPSQSSRGPQTINITLDASTVRSKFAKFDPVKFGESGLLKAGGLPIYSDADGNQLMPPSILLALERKYGMKLKPVEGNPFGNNR